MWIDRITVLRALLNLKHQRNENKCSSIVDELRKKNMSELAPGWQSHFTDDGESPQSAARLWHEYRLLVIKRSAFLMLLILYAASHPHPTLNQGSEFYYNTETRQSTWDRPLLQQLPKPPRRGSDSKDSFSASKQKEDAPAVVIDRSLPPGWESHFSDEGECQGGRSCLACNLVAAAEILLTVFVVV